MKFLLLASFALLCTASTVYKNRNITVDDNGTILITSPTGKRVAITKEVGLNGQGNIEIAISGPNIPTKRIQVDNNWQEDNQWYGDEYRAKRGSSKSKQSQGDVLSGILGEFQGPVSDAQYQSLLKRISGAVANGEISPQVYSLLQGLEQPGVSRGYYPQGDSLYSLYQRPSYIPYANPLLTRMLPSNLMANQQLYGRYLSGYQSLPQSTYYSRYLSGNPLLRQLIGQNQFVSGVQPIQTIQQREQAIQQLEEVKEQLQRNIQSIEELNQIQGGGVSGVQQAIEQQQIAQLSEVQQLEQQELGQLVDTVQQLQGYGYSRVLPQVSQYGQSYGLGRIGQYGVPSYSSVPLSLQRLLGVPQYGQYGQYGQYKGVSSYYDQPYERYSFYQPYGSYRSYQPNYIQGYNTVPQVQVY